LLFAIIHCFSENKGCDFIISYKPLWETIKRKGITQYQLIEHYKFSRGTLDSLRKNKSITLNTLHDLCMLLDCDISDVVVFIKEEEKKES